MRTTDSDLELTKEISPEQLRSLSTETIKELIGALNIQKARLDSDIHDAQIEYRTRRVYANLQWFKKAVAAAKSKGVQLQILHRELVAIDVAKKSGKTRFDTSECLWKLPKSSCGQSNTKRLSEKPCFAAA